MKNMEGFVFSTPQQRDLTMEDKPPDKKGGEQAQSKKSFRDMVTGGKEGPAVRPKRDLLKEELATIAYDDGKPMVTLKELSVFEGLCDPWREALVLKLLGKNMVIKR